MYNPPRPVAQSRELWTLPSGVRLPCVSQGAFPDFIDYLDQPCFSTPPHKLSLGWGRPGSPAPKALSSFPAPVSQDLGTLHWRFPRYALSTQFRLCPSLLTTEQHLTVNKCFSLVCLSSEQVMSRKQGNFSSLPWLQDWPKPAVGNQGFLALVRAFFSF